MSDDFTIKQELLAEVLRRCMGIDADDNARHDFGDMNGGALQRPSEAAAELLCALGDDGLTIAPMLPSASVWTTDMRGDHVNLMAHVVKAHGITLGDSGCSLCAKAAALASLTEPDDRDG